MKRIEDMSGPEGYAFSVLETVGWDYDKAVEYLVGDSMEQVVVKGRLVREQFRILISVAVELRRLYLEHRDPAQGNTAGLASWDPEKLREQYKDLLNKQ